MQTIEDTNDLRSRALASLQKRKEFKAHVAAYLLFNGVLIAIWAMTGAAFFWPALPMLGWGIGLFFHGWDVYGRTPTEEQIQREMHRLE